MRLVKHDVRWTIRESRGSRRISRCSEPLSHTLTSKLDAAIHNGWNPSIRNSSPEAGNSKVPKTPSTARFSNNLAAPPQPLPLLITPPPPSCHPATTSSHLLPYLSTSCLSPFHLPAILPPPCRLFSATPLPPPYLRSFQPPPSTMIEGKQKKGPLVKPMGRSESLKLRIERAQAWKGGKENPIACMIQN